MQHRKPRCRVREAYGGSSRRPGVLAAGTPADKLRCGLCSDGQGTRPQLQADLALLPQTVRTLSRGQPQPVPSSPQHQLTQLGWRLVRRLDPPGQCLRSRWSLLLPQQSQLISPEGWHRMQAALVSALTAVHGAGGEHHANHSTKRTSTCPSTRQVPAPSCSVRHAAALCLPCPSLIGPGACRPSFAGVHQPQRPGRRLGGGLADA